MSWRDAIIAVGGNPPDIRKLVDNLRPAYPGAMPLDPWIRDLDCADAGMDSLKVALSVCNWTSATEYPETAEGTYAAMNKRTEIEAEIERRIGSIICD